MDEQKETFRLAREECRKYFTALCGEEHAIELRVDPAVGGADTDPALDDGWQIDVCDGKGQIIGLNERSLLLAVYRFFVLAGCRFLAPGKEWVPRKKKEEICVCVREFPKNRYRGVVIEGSSSLEDALRMIDHAAKNGMNSYFIQGFNGYPFFKRFYEEQGYPTRDGRPFNYAVADQYCSELEKAVKSRGMFLHSVGHGFHLLAVGCEKYGWDPAEDAAAEKCRDRLAEKDGRRGFFRNVPINTNLCYSDPAVRRIFAEKVADYAQSHPRTDYLHVWLADGLRNHCECARCRKKTASDWYILLLNDVDRVLTDRQIPTKIVFLIYTDLLPPPETERIGNENRFVLMFAPISRSYLRSYTDVDGKIQSEEADYKTFPRNKTPLFTSVETNLVYLKKWRQIFHGDIFSFEYYLMWDCYKNFGMQQLSSVAIRDAEALPALGMRGIFSCQVQRSFFPDGFLLYALARAMLEPHLDYHAAALDYYSCFYGKKGAAIAQKLCELCDEKMFAYNRAELPPTDLCAAESFRKAGEKAKKFLAFIKNSQAENDFIRGNLEELAEYLHVILLQCSVLECAASGEDVRDRYRAEVRPAIFAAEKKYPYDLDGLTMDLIFSIEAGGGWAVLPERFSDVR